MIKQTLTINYEEYSSIEELSAEDSALVRAAIEAMGSSYAPYSHFNVGAAVRLAGGQVVMGTNQENAAYPSGLCAERTALYSAGASFPSEPVLSIAVAGGSGGVLCDNPVTPCGACRQVMAQFEERSHRPMSIIMVGAHKIFKFSKVEDILPLIFDSI